MADSEVSEEAKKAFEAGNCAKQAADHVGAISHYTTGLETASSVVLRSALYVNRSTSLAQLARYKEALLDCEECAKIRPSWSKTYECQAAALQGLGRLAEADATSRLAACLALIKQDPKNETTRIEVRAIREEIKALRAGERRAQFLKASIPEPQTQQQTANDVPSVLSMKPAESATPFKEDLVIQANALQQNKDYETRESVSLSPKPEGTASHTETNALQQNKDYEARESVSLSPKPEGTASHTETQEAFDEVPISWADDAEKLKMEYQMLRARELKLLRNERGDVDVSIHRRQAVSPSRSPTATCRDTTVIDKINKQQETIRAQGRRIEELDNLVRASAHRTGREMQDALAQTKDQIVSLEQLSETQSLEHRKLFTNLLAVQNIFDAQKGVLPNADQDERQSGEKQSADSWLLREREMYIKEHETYENQVALLNKEVRRLEEEGKESSFLYTRHNSLLQSDLQALGKVLEEKESEIQMLEGHLRNTLGKLKLAQDMSCFRGGKPAADGLSKHSELKSHMEYMSAIKRIETLKLEVRGAPCGPAAASPSCAPPPACRCCRSFWLPPPASSRLPQLNHQH
jgi:hypothetical protein